MGLTRGIKLLTGSELKLICRGCPRSDYTARCCLGILKPKLQDVDGDSWEELDATEIIDGAHSLRWLVWVKNLLFIVNCPVFHLCRLHPLQRGRKVNLGRVFWIFALLICSAFRFQPFQNHDKNMKSLPIFTLTL